MATELYRCGYCGVAFTHDRPVEICKAREPIGPHAMGTRYKNKSQNEYDEEMDRHKAMMEAKE